MSIDDDGDRIINWLHGKRLDKWVDIIAICAEFDWQPGQKTYKRMAAARDRATELGWCLTFATYQGEQTPRYKLTEVQGDEVVPGMATRATAAATQWRRIGNAARFVRQNGSDRLIRSIGRHAEETAASNLRQQQTLADILREVAKRDGKVSP